MIVCEEVHERNHYEKDRIDILMMRGFMRGGAETCMRAKAIAIDSGATQSFVSVSSHAATNHICLS